MYIYVYMYIYIYIYIHITRIHIIIILTHLLNIVVKGHHCGVTSNVKGTRRAVAQKLHLPVVSFSFLMSSVVRNKMEPPNVSMCVLTGV